MNIIRKISSLTFLLCLVPSGFAAVVPTTVHPNWTKIELRPAGFQPQVSGMAFLSDGRLVIANWDTVRSRGNTNETPRAFSGKVYVLSGVAGNTPSVTIDTIARGLEDIMGLTVVHDTIYVSGGNTIVRLIRTGNTGPVTRIDTLFILPGTPLTGTSDSLHSMHGSQEYLNGLLYRDGKFFVSPSSLDPIGTVGTPQINPHRGTYLEVTPGNGTTNKRGTFRTVANGIRAASGLGFGPEGRACVSDNQGEWLPGNKLICIQEGKFYGAKKSGGSAAPYYAPWDNLTETPPTVWGVHNEIANSPTAPLLMEYGPYAGQMLMGDVRWGGIQRYFLEKNVQGDLQGAAFVFTGGLEAGVFRMALGPDSMVYVGMIGGRNDNDGYPKNQSNATRVDFGLVKLRYNGGEPAFEMLAVRSRATGFEIEFTKPIDTTVARLAGSYTVQSYYMTPSSSYGGGSKLGSKTLTPTLIRFSPDRRKVFLALDGLVPSTPTQMRVVYIKLNGFKSEAGDSTWSNESWYTLNAFGPGNPFDAPTSLIPPISGKNLTETGASADFKGDIRDNHLSLQVPVTGSFVAYLYDLQGHRLAVYHGVGSQKQSFPLSPSSKKILFVQVRAQGFDAHKLLSNP